MARILIVEDDPNNLDVAQRIVRAAGHEALAAADGVMGLEVARSKRPDAILMDLLLPQLDGWSVTRALRAEPWAQGVPIIAVSALAMQADRALALEAGCDDFVSKPYAPAELRAVLTRYFPVGGATPVKRAGQRRAPHAAAARDRLRDVRGIVGRAGARDRAARASRRRPARRDDAGNGRVGDVPAPARRSGDGGDPGHLRHRARPRRGHREGLRGRRHGLRAEAVRAARAHRARAERDHPQEAPRRPEEEERGPRAARALAARAHRHARPRHPEPREQRHRLPRARRPRTADARTSRVRAAPPAF